MRQGVMIWILQQDREHLHARRFRLASAILQCPLQGTLAVGGIFACLRLGIRIPRQMQLQVPEETTRLGHEQRHCQCEQLPALHEAVGGRIRLAVDDGRRNGCLREREGVRERIGSLIKRERTLQTRIEKVY